jgi:hypothetical protein
MAMFESSTTIRGETSAISSTAGRDGGSPRPALSLAAHRAAVGQAKLHYKYTSDILFRHRASLHRAALKPNGRYRNYMVAAVAPLHRA